MNRALYCLALASLLGNASFGQSFQDDSAPLIEAACIACHDSNTDTHLNFDTLSQDLTDLNDFRQWEKVFDRVSAGEMPPPSEARPDPAQLKTAMSSLQSALRTANRQRQERLGRVPARRLTKREFGYTLQDLLLIDSDVTSGIPDEVESGAFDTVGETQRISGIHMQSYLQAADQAIELAIKDGDNPYYANENNYEHLQEWHEKPLTQGGNITRDLESGKGVALFRDVDYLTQFQFRVPVPGKYRITTQVAAYQSKTPVIVKIISKDQAGNARLLLSKDLQPGEPETISIKAYLQPSETPYLTWDLEGEENFAYLAVGAKHYRGRGLAIISQKVDGPIFESWPPQSTVQLTSTENHGKNSSELAEVTEVLARIAPRAFRRPLRDGELEHFVHLAAPAIEEQRDWPIKVPLRALFSSPQFLLFDAPPGKLDDYALASRLSYFLWKSLPDAKLTELAAAGNLQEDAVLQQQVERMLADPKSGRFVDDFLGQWLRLYKVNATSPDDGLYPEYDELLGDALTKETQCFFRELVDQNLSLTHLIDSDFTFVNRRLAKHYGIEDVKGQEFRKVALPADSPRGGVLTQAAILKTTANGTTTSPVMRGNFVLTNFLGQPPSPPPPGVGSIEPDTRGQTTIREILYAHRSIESCNQCHREIDPPGFALESFDPIGGYREHYRASGGEQTFFGFTSKRPPKKGPRVDPSGRTSDGKSFSDIEQYKAILLEQKHQVAKNFVSQLLVYSTGGEIQFADRKEVNAILNRTQGNDYPIRDLIHEIVQSRIFRHK